MQNQYKTDYNVLDMKIVKNGNSKPLTNISNLAQHTSQSPNNIKTDKAIPLFKIKGKHLLIKYRPASLLPQFSKILEKVSHSRLDNFTEEQYLLTDYQHGFRSNSVASTGEPGLRSHPILSASRKHVLTRLIQQRIHDDK